MADNQRIEPQVLAKYRVVKKIGSGAYGHVWKVNPIDRPTEMFALKKVFEAFQHATDAQRTFREISILKKIEHPNIIKLFQVIGSSSQRDVYLLFEFMSTDLHHLIYEQKLSEVHRKFILYQLLLALHYLHSARLIHRDLKPSNLLVSQHCHLKVCDFGLARQLGPKHQEESHVMTEGVATKWYRAPEVLFGSHCYGQKVDLWSVGCILGEMMLKSPLFNSNSTLAQIEKMIQLIGRPTAQQIKQMGVESVEAIIRQCGSVKQRNPKQIFGHNADQQYIDLLMNLLRFSSQKRFSALQALKHPYLKDFYKESDIRQFKGEVKLQTDDSFKLTTEAYRQLITQHFVQRKQPMRFSDLKREKSFGKVIGELNARKVSGEKEQRRNVHLFEEILREKENSLKATRHNSNQRDKQNVMVNVTGQKEGNLDKFGVKGGVNGTFAGLRKVGGNKLFR